MREKSKDEEMRTAILAVSLVPAEVRQAALKYYLARCYAAHCPAFLEARRMYRDDWHQMEKIKRLIQKRMSNTHMALDALRPQGDIENGASQPTQTASLASQSRQLLQARLVIHGLLERPAPHHIYTFREVALLDPYPKELVIGRDAQLFPKRNVLNVDERPFTFNIKVPSQAEQTFPSFRYIPSKELLFSIMRACAGAECPEELWLYPQLVAERL